MDLLTDDLLLQVLAHCRDDGALLARCSRICRRLRSVLRDDALWQAVCALAWAGRQPPVDGAVLGPELGEAWRAAYIRIMYDASRVAIRRSELCGSKWGLHFHCDMFLFYAQPSAAASRSSHAGDAVFSPSGTFTSTVDGAPSQRAPLKWTMINQAEPDDDSDEPAAGGGGGGGGGGDGMGDEEATHVQVGAYPVLAVARRADGGWCLSNRFVFLRSANRAGPLPASPRTPPAPPPAAAAGGGGGGEEEEGEGGGGW